MPSTPLRRRLRGAGHVLDPVVQVGKHGANPAVIAQVGRALLDHELVKIKLGGECPDSRFTLAETFAEMPGINVVQILGRTILLYKRHPKKPKYEAAPATERATKTPAKKHARASTRQKGRR